MKAASYRRKAILNRIHDALDAFYLLQRIDWEYDIRDTLDKILATALEEIEFGEGRHIERALLIIQGAAVGTLEVRAGWRVEELDMTFSRTVVNEALRDESPILCQNAKDDPRFLEAESLKQISTLSLICVPIRLGEKTIGALYIESHSPTNIFSEDDTEFLQDFSRVIAPYLKVALVHQGHVRQIQKLRTEMGQRHGIGNLIGRSEAMRSVLEMVRLAASVDRTVLITGESGCGKELIAGAIHHQSPRRHGPLIVVDCSGLTDHLLESELFGHVKGSFTGATTDKIGAFEEADSGTIFLDEISDAPKSLQQKLRRVLQEGEIRRVGETLYRKVNVRVICATNRSLPRLVESGEFMRDLFFRINKLPIHIPPLRERREDIPLLTQHFVGLAAEDIGKDPPAVTVEAMELLARLDWKENNVRELRNVVELAVDLGAGRTIELEDVERVLRIQRGEPVGRFPDGRQREQIEAEGQPEGSATPRGPQGLAWINRVAFRSMVERADGGTDPERSRGRTGKERRSTPFYLIQKEIAARAIIEGLRVSDWKLRPAARRLGISPMKLRGELREYIAESLARHGDSLEETASDLDIPVEVLRRKATDLGLGDESP